jgi:rsbT co-antagonist protein RsbR
MASVQRFAEGDLSARAPITRRDEIGELAGAFNHMAAMIERQTHKLQLETDAANGARAEAESAHAELSAQLKTIEAQRAVIREMSIPILPLTETTVVIPLVGALDSARLALVREEALQALEVSTVRHLILDITGVPVVDSQVAQGLMQVVQAARLLGSEVILVGIRPEVAQAIVGLGVHLGDVVTRSSLQSGIAYVLHGRDG